MVTDVSGNSEAFQLANVGDPRVKSASVAELVALTGSAFDAESHIVLPAKPASTPTAAAIFSNNPYPVRTVALNVVRFAFVLPHIKTNCKHKTAYQHFFLNEKMK